MGAESTWKIGAGPAAAFQRVKSRFCDKGRVKLRQHDRTRVTSRCQVKGDGKVKVDMLPQGSPKEGKSKGGCKALHQSRCNLEVLP